MEPIHGADLANQDVSERGNFQSSARSSSIVLHEGSRALTEDLGSGYSTRSALLEKDDALGSAPMSMSDGDKADVGHDEVQDVQNEKDPPKAEAQRTAPVPTSGSSTTISNSTTEVLWSTFKSKCGLQGDLLDNFAKAAAQRQYSDVTQELAKGLKATDTFYHNDPDIAFNHSVQIGTAQGRPAYGILLKRMKFRSKVPTYGVMFCRHDDDGYLKQIYHENIKLDPFFRSSIHAKNAYLFTASFVRLVFIAAQAEGVFGDDEFGSEIVDLLSRGEDTGKGSFFGPAFLYHAQKELIRDTWVGFASPATNGDTVPNGASSNSLNTAGEIEISAVSQGITNQSEVSRKPPASSNTIHERTGDPEIPPTRRTRTSARPSTTKKTQLEPRTERKSVLQHEPSSSLPSFRCTGCRSPSQVRPQPGKIFCATCKGNTEHALGRLCGRCEKWVPMRFFYERSVKQDICEVCRPKGSDLDTFTSASSFNGQALPAPSSHLPKDQREASTSRNPASQSTPLTPDVPPHLRSKHQSVLGKMFLDGIQNGLDDYSSSRTLFGDKVPPHGAASKQPQANKQSESAKRLGVPTHPGPSKSPLESQTHSKKRPHSAVVVDKDNTLDDTDDRRAPKRPQTDNDSGKEGLWPTCTICDRIFVEASSLDRHNLAFHPNVETSPKEPGPPKPPQPQTETKNLKRAHSADVDDDDNALDQIDHDDTPPPGADKQAPKRRRISSNHGKDGAKFTCTICNKVYAHRRNLCRHNRYHHPTPATSETAHDKIQENNPTGDQKPSWRPICAKCGTTFSEKSNLRRHLRTMHSEDEDDEETINQEDQQHEVHNNDGSEDANTQDVSRGDNTIDDGEAVTEDQAPIHGLPHGNSADNEDASMSDTVTRPALQEDDPMPDLLVDAAAVWEWHRRRAMRDSN